MQGARDVSIFNRACEIAKAVAGRSAVVGIFVDMDADEVMRIARRVPLDAVQLHGGESIEDCRRIARSLP